MKKAIFAILLSMTCLAFVNTATAAVRSGLGHSVSYEPHPTIPNHYCQIDLWWWYTYDSETGEVLSVTTKRFNACDGKMVVQEYTGEADVVGPSHTFISLDVVNCYSEDGEDVSEYCGLYSEPVHVQYVINEINATL